MRRFVAVWCLAIFCAATAATAEEIFVKPPLRAGVDWTGWAVGQRRVFKQSAVAEDVARARARTECERAIGRTCSAIAIPDDGTWEVAVLYCANTVSFVGGSPLGNARDVAEEKAKRAGYLASSCVQIYPQ